MAAANGKPIAITMGDPNGIGPEIVCAAVAESEADDLVVIGSSAVLANAARATGKPIPGRVIDITGNLTASSRLVPGTIQREAGALAAAAIERAIAGCLAGEFRAMVTAPIHKQAIALAGVAFPGHTEWVANRCGVANPVMMLWDERIAVALVTCHLALARVPATLSVEAIERTATLLDEVLARLHGRPVRLALCGLNPHAGEGGLFGDEEDRILAPAIAKLRAGGVDIDGPLPPDTAFTPAALARYAGHVCMYHDQGLIPFKTLAFADGVNVTLGIPIVRTSVDHGTAFEIAGRGVADHRSMIAAIDLARRLAPIAGQEM